MCLLYYLHSSLSFVLNSASRRLPGSTPAVSCLPSDRLPGPNPNKHWSTDVCRDLATQATSMALKFMWSFLHSHAFTNSIWRMHGDAERWGGGEGRRLVCPTSSPFGLDMHSHAHKHKHIRSFTAVRRSFPIVARSISHALLILC